MNGETIKAYKGFDKNMQCLGYQYAEGEKYEHEGKVSVCCSGFHACEFPLDALRYYDPKSGNKWHEVECGGEISRKNGEDSKVACSQILIGAEITLANIIKTSVKMIFDKTDKAASGYCSTGAASGNCSTGAASGYYSTGAASGDYSTATATGKSGIAVANGYGARASGALGNYIVLTEYSDDMTLLCVKMHRVDGKIIKPDVLYTLTGGKFKEV